MLKEAGRSTLGAQHIWIDEVSGKLNTDNRGRLLGDFDTGDQLLLLFRDGAYEIADIDMNRRFDPDELLHLGKFHPDTVISAVHYDGNKGWTMVKRFRVETKSTGERFSYLSDHKDSKLLFASVKAAPRIEYSIKIKGKKIQGEVDLADFIDVKGWRAVGNKLSDQKLSSIKEIELPELFATPESNAEETPLPDKLHAGDSIEFDVEKGGQGRLF